MNESTDLIDDINQKAINLIQLMQQLKALIEYENSIYTYASAEELELVVKDKQYLLGQYEEKLRVLLSNPDFPNKLEPVLRTEMTEVARQYDYAVRGNERRLGIMVEAAHFVIDNLVEKARKMAGKVSRYDPTGKTGSRDQATPITINQNL